MNSRASIHLPGESTNYARIVIDGKSAGFLNPTSYDVICRTQNEFTELMALAGAKEEPHSKTGRWVVRLRGEEALRRLNADLRQRD